MFTERGFLSGEVKKARKKRTRAGEWAVCRGGKTRNAPARKVFVMVRALLNFLHGFQARRLPPFSLNKHLLVGIRGAEEIILKFRRDYKMGIIAKD